MLLCAGCKDEERPQQVLKRIFKRIDTSACKLDSAMVKGTLRGYGLEAEVVLGIDSFYLERNYRAAFVNNAGINEYAGNLINLLNNEEISPESLRKARIPRPDSLYRNFQAEKRYDCNDSVLRKLEVLLTANFFEYARRNWGGVSPDISKQAGWFIKRKEIDYGDLLTDFLSDDKSFRVREPVYRQYILLKQYLRKYYDIEKNGRWFDVGEAKIKKGDSAEAVVAVKKLLYLTEDLLVQDSGYVFDAVLEQALIQFQRRHGLDANGKLDDKTLKALRVPVEERVHQLLINMERSRWVPAEVEGKYVIVNIPEFRMYVFENDEPLWNCNVIVGKSNAVNKTVIFNDSIEMVVFSPHWNIPKNIMLNEILPSLKKDKRYLEKNNMEVVDRKGNPIDQKFDWDDYTDHFPYIIRERPGKSNSLGLVKFLFPNTFDIYLHDTPAKTLFNKQSRAFSHGCIRIEKPLLFARYLLKEDSTWTEEKILEYMHGGKETFVKLKKKVPVFIAYFTAWVDREGLLNFREDVYGHDKKMNQLLFVN